MSELPSPLPPVTTAPAQPEEQQPKAAQAKPKYATIQNGAIFGGGFLLGAGATVVLFASHTGALLDKVVPALAALSTVALFFVGVAQVLVYRQQANLMDGSLKEAATAANAAKRAADAAIIGQRAFVFLSTAPTIEANKDLPMTEGSYRPLRFANFGNTPAQIDSLTASCRRWTMAELESLQRQPPGDTINVSAVWLAGGGESLGVQTVAVTATAEEIRMAIQGEGVIALLGHLNYRDMLGEPHEVGFAYILYGISKVTMREIPSRKLNYSR